MSRLTIGFGLLIFVAANSSLGEDRVGPRPLFTVKHDGWVGAVASDSRNHLFFTGNSQGSLGIWNWESGRGIQPRELSDKESISAIGVSPDTELVAIGRYDGTVQTFDCEVKNSPLNYAEEAPRVSLGEIKTLRGHRGAVTCLAFRPKSPTLASGSLDGTVRIWNPREGKSTNVLTGHKSWVNSLDIAKAGDRLVSGSSDGTVKLWVGKITGVDREFIITQTFGLTKAEVRSVRLSPLALQFAAGLRYGDVQIWDVESGKKLHSFKAHDGDCWAVRYSPDGKTLITGGGDWGRPGEVRFWDAKTAELRATLKHSGEVLCITVSPDGRRLAAGGGDGAVMVWDTEKLIGLAPKKD